MHARHQRAAIVAAPQGFEPRYADPESAVLPLNEGATNAWCGSTCSRLGQPQCRARKANFFILRAFPAAVNGVRAAKARRRARRNADGHYRAPNRAPDLHHQYAMYKSFTWALLILATVVMARSARLLARLAGAGSVKGKPPSLFPVPCLSHSSRSTSSGRRPRIR